MFQPSKELVGSSHKNKMVTNAELDKKVEDQEEANRLLQERLMQMEQLLDDVQEKADKVKDRMEE